MLQSKLQVTDPGVEEVEEGAGFRGRRAGDSNDGEKLLLKLLLKGDRDHLAFSSSLPTLYQSHCFGSEI